MKRLLENAALGTLQLKNRLIRSGTAQGMRADTTYDLDLLPKIYDDLARGGVGAVITSFPLVDRDYYRNGDAPENRQQTYEQIVSSIHRSQCVAIAQLVLVSYKDGMAIDKLTTGDISAVRDMFVSAARKAMQVGYDGVQIHAAHSLFLSRWISPLYNHRKDAYGGDQKNRARLVQDILREIRETCPGLHISMKINHSDDVPGGLTEEQSLETCILCEEAGLDSIEVSGNGTSASGIRAGINESYFQSFALKLADHVSIPVILVGGNRSIESMERILNAGNIGFMSLSRPLIREPALPNRWMAGDTVPAKCVSCNMCYKTPLQQCIFNMKERNN